MASSKTRILVADDHNLLAELCKRLLETEFDVVGIVSNGRELVAAAANLTPHVIVLDIGMPLLNGLDAGTQVKNLVPGVKLVFLTVNTDPELALKAFERGASGYLLKTCAASEMVAAIRAVLKGGSYVSPALRDKVNQLRWEQKTMVDGSARLTQRQREVLQLLAEGKSMKEAGAILYLTARTVAFHKYRIMQVLGADTTADLVRYAVRNRMIAV
jgi:DNA-binding NarL/FixJ family response regulator